MCGLTLFQIHCVAFNDIHECVWEMEMTLIITCRQTLATST